MNNSLTKVLFRVYPEGDVIALFPDEKGTPHSNDCLSYQKVGQHGLAHFNAICQETRKAHQEEYQGLHTELIRQGYVLEVVPNYRRRKGML